MKKKEINKKIRYNIKKKKLIKKMINHDIKNNRLFYKIKVDSLSSLLLNTYCIPCSNNGDCTIDECFEDKKYQIIKKQRIKTLFYTLKYIIKYINNNTLLEYFFVNIYFDKNKIFYADILICIKPLIAYNIKLIHNYLTICSPCEVTMGYKPNSIIYYLDSTKSIYNFFKKKPHKYKVIRINRFNNKINIFSKLKAVKKPSVQSIINFWIIYIKTNKLYCKDNKLFKIDEKSQLIYYKNISHLVKDISYIYSYVLNNKKEIDIRYCLPEIFIFNKMVTIYIDKAYKLIKKNNGILNI